MYASVEFESNGTITHLHTSCTSNLLVEPIRGLCQTFASHKFRRLSRQDGGTCACASANLTFVFYRRKVPRRPPSGPRGILFHRYHAIITYQNRCVGSAAKCLTRCSKLHLIQRPRLAKWHIVRGASINGSPLPSVS